jgi:hypothetical protein
MDDKQLECWTHILISPAYVMYNKYRYKSQPKLYNAWSEAMDNMDSIDQERRVQAWHDLMALRRVLVEHGTWDQKLRGPVQPTTGKPKWVEKGIEPGTQEWIEHWKAHPEDQASMCKRATRLNNHERRLAG